MRPAHRLRTGLAATDVLLLLAALLALLAWDTTSLDLVLVGWWGSAAGFAWRDHWLTRTLLHDGGRVLAWVVMAALAISVWRPLPFARSLDRPARLWWLAACVACLLAVSLLKRASLTSCPWSLREFGGLAHHVSHLRWGIADGGEGHCFPSGHASAAFAFLPGYWILRDRRPAAARRWLGAVVMLGAVFGWAQMMRGAHYASHTLWTAWVCWCVTLACVAASRWSAPFVQRFRTA